MEDFTPDLEQCLEALHQGGLILYPTDTVWGLGCDATNEEAVSKLVKIKGKSRHGLIVLLASERDILKYVTQPDLAVFDYLEKLNKPTTVIYKGGTSVAEPVLASDGSIAIRLVKDEFCRHLVKRFRKPIVSTSANFHGKPTPETFLQIDSELFLSVDYVAKYRQNEIGKSAPSSIIRWKADGRPEILRP
ncbi:Sua5/YciO/YrdC/YwlC family protein [Segetibacter sp. 3557_3]|uniref:L-threonylcarbamoyladenylate synthase n=1 Tax=Segetibacter sp. 3557_3 TaxID=2547429 RepID=UPI001058EC65|nr:L-threonylcarbamoyladenylate synthase [Segetibacter sp. 3557_3]TDH28751.1 Sua5/YciO/YrdC/YwlC family protein [Segetibacter sp. 3557_3]